MMKIYTCFNCGFPFAREEDQVPETCPGCGAPRSQYLEEPWCGDIRKRRIHVDPMEADPNRDPYDVSFHIPKDFAPQKGHGRARKFVIGYDRGMAEVIRKYYTDAFGWDIIDAEHSDPENPVMYCATGPGTADWEPWVPSFAYGFLVPRESGIVNPEPSFVIEVKSIDDTCKKVLEYGGKVLRERFTFEGQDYAVIEDSEGNQLYIWEVEAIPDYCIHPVKDTGAR